MSTYKFIPADESNYTKGRTAEITDICIHHMAGVLSAGQCGKIFARAGRNGSSHYGIGNDGEIACYVYEEDTAWTNSNWDSNCRSINIEVSNSELGGDWSVSAEAYDSLINLVADIAKRRNLGILEPGKNLTWHSMFTATACPGKFLLDHMQDIANKANAINFPPAPEPEPELPNPEFKEGDIVVPTELVDYNGTPLVQYDETYTITQIIGDRAVLSARGTIWAAMNTKNIRKA